MAGREMLGVGTKGLDMVPGWLFLWEKKLRCKRKSTGDFHGKEASARSRVQPRLPFGFWACIPGFSLVGSVLQPTLPILGHCMSSFWAAPGLPCRSSAMFHVFRLAFLLPSHFQTIYRIDAQFNVHNSYVQHISYAIKPHLGTSPHSSTKLTAPSIHYDGSFPATLSKLSRPIY